MLAPLLDYLKAHGDYRILVMPDHPTPLCTRTHSSDPVPYLLFDSRKTVSGVDVFSEATAAETGNFVPHGPSIMDKLLEK